MINVRKLVKRFGSKTVLRGLDFEVLQGEFVALLGPNGAGKTTLFHLITGIIPPSGGEVEFMGRSLESLKPHAIARLGIARTFQNLEIFSNMTVWENVMVGRHVQTVSGLFRVGLRFPGMRKEEKEIKEKAREELHFMGLEGKAGMNASALPLGEQKLLEIARALATQPKLLLLDEPAAGLNMRETGKLSETILRIHARGITVMLVEHDMNLVMEISDEVLVLNYGKKIAEGPPRKIQRNPEVIAAYLGEEIGDA